VSNIVKRLRGLAKAEMFLGAYTEAKSITDAADEIERLRAELAEATKDRNVFFADLVDTKSRLAEAERDAVRYRWLEQWINENTSGFEIFPIGPGNEYGPDGNTIIDVNFYYLADEKWPVKTLDDAIDAAMGKP